MAATLVAKLLNLTPSLEIYLKDDNGVDIVADANGNPVINEQDANDLLTSSDYTLIEWAGDYYSDGVLIALPRPRRK